jgi:hypothetical protein
MTGPREVLKLKVRERTTNNMKISTAGPREVLELEIQECPPST